MLGGGAPVALGYFGAQTSGLGSRAQIARSSYKGRLPGFSVALSARVRGDLPSCVWGGKSRPEGAGCVFLAVLSPSCRLPLLSGTSYSPPRAETQRAARLNASSGGCDRGSAI